MNAMLLGLLLITAFVTVATPGASALCTNHQHGSVGPLYYDTGSHLVGTTPCHPHPPCVDFSPC